MQNTLEDIYAGAFPELDFENLQRVVKATDQSDPELDVREGEDMPKCIGKPIKQTSVTKEQLKVLAEKYLKNKLGSPDYRAPASIRWATPALHRKPERVAESSRLAENKASTLTRHSICPQVQSFRSVQLHGRRGENIVPDE